MRFQLFTAVLEGGPCHGERHTFAAREAADCFLSRDADGDLQLHTLLAEADGPGELTYGFVGDGSAESLCDLGYAEAVEKSPLPNGGGALYALSGGPGDGCKVSVGGRAGKTADPFVTLATRGGRTFRYELAKDNPRPPDRSGPIHNEDPMFVYVFAGPCPAGLGLEGAAALAGRDRDA